MSLMARRRALMAAKGENSTLGLKPGSGYGKSANTVVSVNNNGQIVVEKWKTAWANRFQIPFTGSLTLQSGDIVRIVLKKVSGTAASKYSSFWFYTIDWQCWNNEIAAFNDNTIKDKTVTASKNGTLNSFVMQLHSSDITTAFTMSIEIYINGKLVLK